MKHRPMWLEYIEKCYKQKQDSYLHSYRTSNFALNMFQMLQFSFTVLIVYYFNLLSYKFSVKSRIKGREIEWETNHLFIKIAITNANIEKFKSEGSFPLCKNKKGQTIYNEQFYPVMKKSRNFVKYRDNNFLSIITRNIHNPFSHFQY